MAKRDYKQLHLSQTKLSGSYKSPSIQVHQNSIKLASEVAALLPNAKKIQRDKPFVARPICWECGYQGKNVSQDNKCFDDKACDRRKENWND